jgi:hypothetical protein
MAKYVQRMTLKRVLVLILAMALFVAGMPLAHATANEAAPSSDMAHRHDTVSMALADRADHMHAHDGMANTADHRDDHGKLALDLCKCLNCGMCGTPGVTTPVRELAPERRMLAVTYRPFSTERTDASTSVDPGIPIRLM